MARKKIAAIMWTWSTETFWAKHTDGSIQRVGKHTKLPSGAIAAAVGSAGRYVPLKPYTLTAKDKATLRRMKA